MQGILDNQTSGNDWSQSGQTNRSLLHEGQQQPWHLPGRVPAHGRFFAGYEQQMTRFDQGQTDALREIDVFYSIRNDAEIKEFLHSHKLVTQVLAEAIAHLMKHFEGCMFSLRLRTDEYNDQMLYAVAAWKDEPAKVIAALNALDDEWWLANSYPAGRHLSFTYDLA